MPDPGPTSRARRPARRILSLWFPRMAAERVLRLEPALTDLPLVVVRETGNLRDIASLNGPASRAGLRRGQALAEAVALCPDLVTRSAEPEREAQFLIALRRWAEKFSPWIAEDGEEALMIDLTGCAHLFGGEEPLLKQVYQDCTDLGLTLCAGIADTPGAAWAIARYAGGGGLVKGRSGDAIDQEARATRSRAQKRHWVRGGPVPEIGVSAPSPLRRISPPGTVRQSLTPLPIAALRVPPEVTTGLGRLGLRRIGDLWGMPRAGLARRFGRVLVHRLDQALGVEAEPISPAGTPLHFAVRLSLPEPIGLEADILAGLDRLLPRLCDKLRAKGRGARRIRLEMSKLEGGTERIEIGLARITDRPDTIRPLLAMKLGDVEAGFGLDALRVVAPVTEPLPRGQAKPGWNSQAGQGAQAGLEDLLTRIGTRVGLERITREYPSDSHIPEKTASQQAVAFTQPADTWPVPTRPRPLILFRPEPVTAPDLPHVPAEFRWRGRVFRTQAAQGPERIAPEWWLDDPNWRTGVRDYWRVLTEGGARIWLYYAHGGTMTGGWFAHGDFG